jgi:uncharacterized membrane protein YidH (DUF202 family)
MQHPSGRAPNLGRALRVAAWVSGAVTVLLPIGIFFVDWPVIPQPNGSVGLMLLVVAILTTTTLVGAADWVRRERQPRDKQRAAALWTAAKVGCALAVICAILCLLIFVLFEYADYA